MIKNLSKKFIYIMLSLASIALTIFVFLNSFEFIFSKDIAFVHSFNKSTLTEPINFVVSQSIDQKYYFTSKSLFKDKKLEFLEIPVINKKLEIARASNNNQIWYSKGNKANYIVTVSPDSSENIIFYMDSSWRTIPSLSNVKEGDLIYINREDDWIYIFKIDSLENITASSRFASRSSGDLNLILLLNHQDQSQYTVIQAHLINSTSR